MKIVGGDGPYLIGEGGKRFLDFTSGGIFAAILGNSWPEHIPKTMPACYGAHYQHPAVERYKDMLKELTGYESVALFTTGSEATEAFWRCMRTYTGRPGIWGGLPDPDNIGSDTDALPDAMHGMTLGALIMAGKISWHELGESRFSTPPGSTCGMIMEPYHAPSARFYPENPIISRIRGHRETFPEIAFCMDEIQGGFGRTGKLFAHHWYEPELRPDFICIGKACGGGYPLSALLGPKEIMESKVVVEEAHLHSTHSGHPLMATLGCSVLANIEHILSRSAYLGDHLHGELEARIEEFKVHSGRGLLAGVDFGTADRATAVAEACERRGLLVVNTGRKWVKLGPSVALSPEMISDGCEIIQQAIEEVCNAETDTTLRSESY